MESKYKPGDELELTVEKIVPRGLGLAFADGLTVFVPLSAPGDRLTVMIERIKGGVAFAEIVEVLEPSPVRGIPPCKYFGICGGCDFQQFPYAGQLEMKVGIIRDALFRIGRIEMDDIPIIASPRPLNYRTRALWHIDTAARKMGYYKRNSHDVVDVDHCPILDPTLEAVMQRIRGEVSEGVFWSEKAVVEAARGTDGQVSINSPDLPEPLHDVTVVAAGERFTFNARSFFQGNLSIVEPLIEAAVGGSAGGSALDLYCGVGLFSLPLARSFREVIGVEANSAAIAYARRNAADAGLANVEFVSEGVGKFLHGRRELKDVDLVVLDPPRAGTEKNVIRRIIEIGPLNVTYVACDPSVLARDLRRLIDGGYSIDSVVALDLFPQTHHVETVARLSRK